MTEEMLIEMRAIANSPTMDSPTIDYVIDELIPYCKGIDAL